MIQLLNSCPDLFRSTSFGKSQFRSRSYRLPRPRGKVHSSYKKLSRYTSSRFEDYTSSTELQSPGITDSSFTLLANLQLSVNAFGPDFSCLNTSTMPESKPSSSQPTLSSFENNPPNLRKQGRLALTFALRKYGDIPSEERIALANDIEEAIDKIYVASQYRENIYLVGGLLAEDGAGEETVVKLVNKETTIGDVLMWSVRSDEWEDRVNMRE